MLTALPGDFLYLDESGDLGLSGRSTPFFVVGILHLNSESALGRAAKRARRRALGRRSGKGELKWSTSSPAVRLAMIEEICREKALVAGVSAAVIDKLWINEEHGRRPANVRYNFAARFALEEGGLFEPTKSKRLILTVDERDPLATKSITEYLDRLRGRGDLCCTVTVRGRDSQQCPQLQAADFAVGAIYAAYAQRDFQYLNALERGGVLLSLRVRRKRKPAP